MQSEFEFDEDRRSRATEAAADDQEEPSAGAVSLHSQCEAQSGNFRVSYEASRTEVCISAHTSEEYRVDLSPKKET